MAGWWNPIDDSGANLHYYGANGKNVADILNGKLYVYDAGNFNAQDPDVQSVVQQLSPRLATPQEISDVINEDGPGNGAGKGSMQEGLRAALAFIVSAGLGGPIGEAVGSPIGGKVAASALSSAIGGGNPLVGAAMGGAGGTISDALSGYLSTPSVPGAGGPVQLADSGGYTGTMNDAGPGYTVGDTSGLNDYYAAEDAVNMQQGKAMIDNGYMGPGVPGYIPPNAQKGTQIDAEGNPLPPGAEQQPAPVTDGTVKPVSSGFNSITDALKTAAPLAPLLGTAAALTAGSTDPLATDPTTELRNQEAARLARVKEGTDNINSTFGAYDDSYFDGIANAYKQHYQPLLDEQATEARRVLPFGSSTTSSSAYQRRAGNLERDIARATADIGSQADDAATKQRGQVESNRSDLLNLANSGADVESVAASSAARARQLAAPPAFSPIADLFQKYAADAANASIAASHGYASPTFSRPLTFGAPRSAVRNVTG